MNAQEVRELFNYDEDTGNLLWKKAKARRTKIGSIAGVFNPASVVIMVNYTNYKAHRLVWLFHYGEFPPGELDHIDGNPLNNRIDNLRLATRKQNAANVKRHIDNDVGYKGVSISRNKYLARICGRRIGLFDTPEEASAAYEAAAKELFGEFYRG